MRLEDLRKLNLDMLITLKGLVSLMRDPEQTNSVFDVEDGLRHTKAAQLATDYAKSKPGVADIFAERYLAPPPDVPSLLKLPDDSLGHAYALYITEAGFDPNFYRKTEIEDDVTYLFMRMRQTHDIWHVVTGFGVDVNAELGLKAFEIAQVHRTLSAMLVAGGLLRTLFKTPENLDGLLEQVAIGYRMGARAKPFLAQKWEEHWEKPVAVWRRELNVEPATTYIP
ncbi:Coq4 family protein [Thermocoleostomius sinensis]|uniref:Coq4 family protein n=1 Tax=Thermocoleostomius sinensis A174 TaxID=2016057 RepID=A0A9E8ZDA9_9CYAN|nr:Coq4 family protein [Thermocoleostomius sinensis]WAL61180.1 Coq4 family protein [Thermocoleostomius sinensis A174]